MSQESRNAGKELRDRQITQEHIGAAIAVHTELGPGFLESVYEQALAVEFAIRGIAFVRQKPIPLFYKDHQIGEHRLDFLVEDKIVIELKAVEHLEKRPFRYRPQLFESRGFVRRLDSEFLFDPLDGEARSRERTFQPPDLHS